MVVKRIFDVMVGRGRQDRDGDLDGFQGFRDELQGLRDETRGLLHEAQGLRDETRGLLDEARGLRDEGVSVRAEATSAVEESQDTASIRSLDEIVEAGVGAVNEYLAHGYLLLHVVNVDGQLVYVVGRDASVDRVDRTLIPPQSPTRVSRSMSRG